LDRARFGTPVRGPLPVGQGCDRVGDDGRRGARHRRGAEGGTRAVLLARRAKAAPVDTIPPMRPKQVPAEWPDRR